MSFIKDALFGTKGTPSKVVNTTPAAFQNLAAPLANILSQRLFNPVTFQGAFAAPITAEEQAGLTGVQRAASGVGQIGGAMNMLAGATGLNPFARLSEAEQFGLGQVMQQAFGQSPLELQARGVIGQQLGGVMNPFAQAAGLTGAEAAGLDAIRQAAFGQSPLQQTVNQQLQSISGSGGIHPQLDQLIGAATRPILEQFSDEALRQRGLFTGAGQQIQGQGSSPFAQASARLTSGVANAVGDTAAQLTAQLNQQQQQAQLAALGMAQQQPALQLQNMLAGQSALALPREIAQTGLNLQNQAFQQMVANQLGAAGLADQLQGNAFARALAGLDAAGLGQRRGAEAFESQQQRQLQAGSQMGQQQLASQMAALEAQLQNLQAQGLPRMIQQLGIDAGLAQFNQEQAQIMNLMQLMGALASPNSVVLPGTPGTPGAVQSFAGGLGAGLGSNIKLSDRRLKRDIVHVATLPSGTKLYEFRIDGGTRKHIGVIADEVAHIPGAVIIEPLTGVALVDYAKVA